MEIKLKPCPFCGGEAEMYLSNDNPPAYGVKHYCHFGKNTYQIRIETKWQDTPEKAAEVWNTREERSGEE